MLGVEIQQLRHFVCAVECGNLAGAADQCNISQSGLSRSIRALEDRLGLTLLVRTPKGVEPTAYGDALVQRARLILNEVERSVRELRALEASQTGQLCCGVTQNYGFSFFPGVLAAFRGAYPGVHVTITTGGYLDLAAQVRNGLLDFAFGLLGRIDDYDDLTIENFREHHSRVIARAGHILAEGDAEVTPAQLSAASWAALGGAGFQRNFADYFILHGLPRPVQAVRTDSIALIRELVAATDLLAVLPPDLIRAPVEAGTLVILNCEAPAEQTHVGMVFRAGGLLSPAASQLVSRLRAAMVPGLAARA